MKHLILFLLFLSISYSQNVGRIAYDTVKIQASKIPVAAYAANEIIRGNDSAFYRIGVGQNLPTWGMIRAVIVETDTPNVTNAAFIVRFYNFSQVDTAGTYAGTNSDTTGYSVLTGIDNSVFQNQWTRYDRFFIGDVATTAQSSGGLGTSAKSANYAANLPFYANKGKLWVVLLANAAYTGKKYGWYRIRVVYERGGL
jgi:hypothetical protein